MKTIPQRTLRNEISRVLREVEEGEPLRITIDGRPVADLIPIRRETHFVSRSEVAELLRGAPADQHLLSDVRALVGATIDEL